MKGVSFGGVNDKQFTRTPDQGTRCASPYCPSPHIYEGAPARFAHNNSTLWCHKECADSWERRDPGGVATGGQDPVATGELCGAPHPQLHHVLCGKPADQHHYHNGDGQSWYMQPEQVASLKAALATRLGAPVVPASGECLCIDHNGTHVTTFDCPVHAAAPTAEQFASAAGRVMHISPAEELKIEEAAPAEDLRSVTQRERVREAYRRDGSIVQEREGSSWKVTYSVRSGPEVGINGIGEHEDLHMALVNALADWDEQVLARWLAATELDRQAKEQQVLDQLGPLEREILDGLAAQGATVVMCSDTWVHVVAPFDIRELATYMRTKAGHPDPDLTTSETREGDGEP